MSSLCLDSDLTYDGYGFCGFGHRRADRLVLPRADDPGAPGIYFIAVLGARVNAAKPPRDFPGWGDPPETVRETPDDALLFPDGCRRPVQNEEP